MTLGYFDIVNPRRIYTLPKRDRYNSLFAKRGAEYVANFFTQVRGLANIGIVSIRGGQPKLIAMRRLG